MATNIPMIEALENYAKDLLQLFSQLRAGRIPPSSQLDQLDAWTRLLQQHVKAQKKQGGQYPHDIYSYDPGSKRIERYRGGQVVSTI